VTEARAEVADWRALVGRDSHEIALHDADGSLTVGELERDTRRLAADFEAAGAGPGERIVVALPNGRLAVAAFLAARLCGAVIVNVPPQWRRELVAIADETDARVVLAYRAGEDEALAPLASRLLAPRGSGSGVDGDPVARAEDAPAWLAYTSGTTGAPMGAVHTEGTLARMPQGFIDRYALGESDCILVAAPVGHAVGFVYGVMLALRAGCPMVLMGRWDAQLAAALVGDHGCSFVAAPTPFLLDAVERAERHPGAFAGLRTFLCGGAPVPLALLARARRAFRDTDATAYYGTSECGGVATCPPDAPLELKLATDGTPLPDTELRLEGGELHVRSPQNAGRYWGPDPEERFAADGWCRTGDLATIDEHGYLRITGRVRELIRRGGVAISPLEVEEVVATHPRVREAAVVGLRDERLGERVAVAIVAPSGAPGLGEIQELCRAAGLARVKWPERVEVLAELPRGPSGKLLRRQVRVMLGEVIA